jgi:hypothetical protein
MTYIFKDDTFYQADELDSIVVVISLKILEEEMILHGL